MRDRLRCRAYQRSCCSARASAGSGASQGSATWLTCSESATAGILSREVQLVDLIDLTRQPPRGLSQTRLDGLRHKWPRHDTRNWWCVRDRRLARVEERRDQREYFAGPPCHADVRGSGEHCELGVGQELEHLHHV